MLKRERTEFQTNSESTVKAYGCFHSLLTIVVNLYQGQTFPTRLFDTILRVHRNSRSICYFRTNFSLWNFEYPLRNLRATAKLH